MTSTIEFFNNFNSNLLVQGVIDIILKYPNAMTHPDFQLWDSLLRNPSQQQVDVHGIPQNVCDINSLFKRAKVLEIVNEFLLKCRLIEGSQNPDGSPQQDIDEVKTRIVNFVVQSLSDQYGENIPFADVLDILNEIISQMSEVDGITETSGLTRFSTMSTAFNPIMATHDGPPQEVIWGTDQASQSYYEEN